MRLPMADSAAPTHRRRYSGDSCKGRTSASRRRRIDGVSVAGSSVKVRYEPAFNLLQELLGQPDGFLSIAIHDQKIATPARLDHRLPGRDRLGNQEAISVASQHGHLVPQGKHPKADRSE